MIVFAFAFGLSMDYEVFLLGRIKEYVDAGVPTDTAVRRGLQHTGRVITSAALLMVIVFGCFAAARIGNIEQIGLGLTVAVLIDATVVRCLLVPATMTLLGRWNWWAPAWLRRAAPSDRARAMPTAPDGGRTHRGRRLGGYIERLTSSQSHGGSWYGPRNTTAHSSAQRRWPIVFESISPGSRTRRRSRLEVGPVEAVDQVEHHRRLGRRRTRRDWSARATPMNDSLDGRCGSFSTRLPGAGSVGSRSARGRAARPARRSPRGAA